MRILYVEDNLTNVSLVRRVARMGEHEIVHYIEGESALEHWGEIQPDLVLMDLQLAGDISGLDVVRQLRARGVDTPIVAVTAYAMLGDRDRCLAAGCDEYLAKPLAIHQLVEMFRHYSSQPPQITRSAVPAAVQSSPFAALSATPAPSGPLHLKISLDDDPPKAQPTPAPESASLKISLDDDSTKARPAPAPENAPSHATTAAEEAEPLAVPVPTPTEKEPPAASSSPANHHDEVKP